MDIAIHALHRHVMLQDTDAANVSVPLHEILSYMATYKFLQNDDRVPALDSHTDGAYALRVEYV